MNGVPPRFAQKLLLRFLRNDLAEEVQGDLDEKFYVIAKERSLVRAKLNYWYQVFNYLRPFAIRKSKPYHPNQYDMFQSYFKIGWRNLLKNKGYSLINIGGLAIGMAVAIMIGLWIHDEMTFNKYHENYETVAQVYRNEIYEGHVESNYQHVTGLGSLLRTEYGGYFKNVAMVMARVEDRVIALGEKKFTQNGYFMQPAGPEMLSLKMIHGTRDGLKEMKSILLSESLAKKIFGDADPINQIVTMNAKSELKVTGVFEDLPKNSAFREATYFAPFDLYIEGWGPDALNKWDNYFVCIYVQIHPDGDMQKTSSIIKNAMLSHVREEVAQAKPEVFLHPMAKWHLQTQFENGVNVTSARMKFVWFYGIIGIFVLLLACINFMNLSTARSEKRAREVGIRKSIGSLRSQLIQQFFGESLLVAGISFLISLLVVQLSLSWFNTIADKSMLMPWNNLLFWGGGIAFTLITGLLAGSYPALYLSSFSAVKVLKGTFKAGRMARVPRRVLVVVQFTVSICLVIGTLVVYRQIQFAKNRPTGYSRQGMISLRARSPEYFGKYQLLRTELKNTGVVEEIAEANYPVTSFLGWNGGFSWKGQPIAPSFNTIFVTPEYGKTVGLEFSSGRDFSREIQSDETGILLNESAVKEMGLTNPVGEHLTWAPGGTPRGTYQILGVVKDMVKGSPFDQTFPSVIFYAKNDQEWLYIRIKPHVSPHDALPKIQEVYAKVIPSSPFDYTFADEDYGTKFKAEERVGTLAGIFSFLAILISCSGLFGLASFMAEQRTKEISIRKVLGASVTQVWQLMSKEFVVLIIISCVIAIPLSVLFMDKWLQQYQYRTAIEWYVFALAGIGALTITLITVSFQAIKAAVSNPVDSLKTE